MRTLSLGVESEQALATGIPSPVYIEYHVASDARMEV